MWIMIAGPYRSGAQDSKKWAENLRILNEAAVAVFHKGHVPVIGVNLALPVIAAAGEEHYQEMMMPISLALAERCDAVLRIGGASSGADQEVDVFEVNDLPIYRDLSEVPDVNP